MVASTNHLDKLDAGLSSRPSRFDRKYLFPLPAEEERKIYCMYWRNRLVQKKVDIEFPVKICGAAALITDGFSFAYLQEAFVATLLAIAGRRSEVFDEDVNDLVGGGDEDVNDMVGGGDDGDRDLDDYELWREMKKTIKMLRDDMDAKVDFSTRIDGAFENALAEEKAAQAPAVKPRFAAARERAVGLAKPDSWAAKKPEDLHVQGRALRFDDQHAPIIGENNAFVYSSE